VALSGSAPTIPPMDLDFYSTSAQVLPVLMLTIVVELRTDKSSDPGWDLLVSSVALATLVAAEAGALHVLSTGSPSDDTHGLITAGYIAGATAIVLLTAGFRVNSVPFLEGRARLKGVAWILWIVLLWLLLRVADVA
jgi:hypothetical protein